MLYDTDGHVWCGQCEKNGCFMTQTGMYDSIDSGNFVISVFLDFKKAFDTVDHKILLSKLNFYGIRGVSHELLKSYLSERNQITVIDGIT